MGPLSNDDQEPWAPPGDRGLLPAPLFPDDDDDVPPPERPGADRETMRMRCALVLGPPGTFWSLTFNVK